MSRRERDTASHFGKADGAQEQLTPITLTVPCRQTGVASRAFAQFGHHVRIKQMTVHERSRSRGISRKRAKSSSLPASGISKRSPFRSGNSSLSLSASSDAERNSKTSRF